ncbi:MAG: hypothetical protein ACI4EF_04090, partial [Coprococcus sp.]
VARYRFISKGDNIDGFYGGNSFANQIGITTQVPRVVERELFRAAILLASQKLEVPHQFFIVYLELRRTSAD